jgi:hypothetical protein
MRSAENPCGHHESKNWLMVADSDSPSTLLLHPFPTSRSFADGGAMRISARCLLLFLRMPRFRRIGGRLHLSQPRLRPGRGVVEFPNLGRDAIMVVPCPIGAASKYGHLAAFIRQAPESQKHALWEVVGEAMERRLGKSPVWLSTAGAGVSWLHVRLDDRPKYYGYGPYRRDGGQAARTT